MIRWEYIWARWRDAPQSEDLDVQARMHGNLWKERTPMNLIERIETKARAWSGEPYKCFADATPMHPFSVLQTLANELRMETGLPLERVWSPDADGNWAWRDVAPEKDPRE